MSVCMCVCVFFSTICYNGIEESVKLRLNEKGVGFKYLSRIQSNRRRCNSKIYPELQQVVINTAQKIRVQEFFTFPEEIFNRKLHYFYSATIPLLLCCFITGNQWPCYK